MAVARVDSSSCHTEATFSFLTSGMTREARMGAHMVFVTCLTDLAHLLMSGGGGVRKICSYWVCRCDGV